METIKILGRSVRQYKLQAILAPLTVSGEVIMEVLIPTLMAVLIDQGIDQGNMPVIWRYGLILLICAIISMAFGALAGIFTARASAGFAANLRGDMYRRVQDFSFENIDRFSTASLVTRMTTDVTNVQMAFMMIIRMAVRSPVMLLFALIMSIRIDAKLTSIFLVVLPILGIGLYIIIVWFILDYRCRCGCCLSYRTLRHFIFISLIVFIILPVFI